MQQQKKRVLKSDLKNMSQAGVAKPVYLKYAYLILILITSLVYFRVCFLGFTELDDKFFIVQNEQFNKDLGNIPVSFSRGLFGPTNDLYYRPVFLVDMILEHAIFGTSPAGYHVTNLLFHLLTVCLLYFFLTKIRIPDPDALILSSLFAVHPVLSQAVAWIPGRNDMMLMIFFLASMISSIQYYHVKPDKGKIFKGLWLTSHFIFLLLALFTKETAVVIPFIVLALMFFVLKKPWKSLIPLMITGGIAILIWFVSRSNATLLNEPVSFEKMVSTGISRIPAMVQYLGKIFFPVNLTVFPMMEDTRTVWGIVALILMTGLIIASKGFKNPLVILGILWFLIFLAPVLIVPKSLNDQVFEHRLYIPVIGILMILSQSIIFTHPWKAWQKIVVALPIIIIFGIMAFIRIPIFNDSDTFWRVALKDSPHAITPCMMLVNGTITAEEREKIRERCYTLPQDQMMVNYTLGKIYMQQNQDDSAKRHFLMEIPFSQFADIYYQLGIIYNHEKNPDSSVYCFKQVVSLDPGHPNTPQVELVIRQLEFEQSMAKAMTAVNTNQPDTAAFYLQQAILLDPANVQAHNNLVLLYYNNHQKEKAREILKQMNLKGLKVSPELEKLVQR